MAGVSAVDGGATVGDVSEARQDPERAEAAGVVGASWPGTRPRGPGCSSACRDRCSSSWRRSSSSTATSSAAGRAGPRPVPAPGEDPWRRLADFAFVVLAVGHALVGVHGMVRRRLGAGPGGAGPRGCGWRRTGAVWRELAGGLDRAHPRMIRHLEPVRPVRRPDPDLPGGDDHPMRIVTREVARDASSWTPQRRAEVAALFEELAGEWHTRDRPGREAPLLDALQRGDVGGGTCLELGAGTGIGTRDLARAFGVVAVDLAGGMLDLFPPAARMAPSPRTTRGVAAPP
ncbi:MAG: class I SAM-dependent methyltransferase [Acidimicrobiia bacterium]|nr:class I SAM-dependent methyltransferase [Acidimicrobiia bacterium]